MRELKYRTGLKRVGAAVVDGIIFMPFFFVEQALDESAQSQAMRTAWRIFVVFSPAIYSIVLQWKFGYTIGKWVAQVKLLDVSESRSISLKQAILRNLVVLLILTVGLIYAFVYEEGPFEPGFYRLNETALFLWALAGLICMLSNKKRRALHDFIASTVVVRCKL